MLIALLTLTLTTIATVELIRRLPILSAAEALIEVCLKAREVVFSQTISPHWKDMAVPAYAGQTLWRTLKLTGIILFGLCPLIEGAMFLAVFDPAPHGGLLSLVIPTLVTPLYLTLRHRIKPSKQRSGYSPAARTLHRLFLARPATLRGLFAIERLVAPAPRTARQDHVFVSGLARAGTTSLMRALYASGAFASLTYRDMPGVMMPRLWSWVTRLGGSGGPLKERAHGDGILIDQDSPEALDEPFWRAYCERDYVGTTSLRPHCPSVALTERYRTYIDQVCHRAGHERYLSKSNNGLLRLPALRRQFPKALFLIPLRQPADHAASLWRQHRRFSDRTDPFIADYMRWLGHYEFGTTHRPFRFGEGTPLPYDPHRTDYWLAYWIAIHQAIYLQVTTPGTPLFPLAYEDLCDPASPLRPALSKTCGVALDFTELTRRPDRRLPRFSPALLSLADSLYGSLRALSHERFELRTENSPEGPKGTVRNTAYPRLSSSAR
ncbi:hypothetical protein PB2503_05442 [Parvularcula bermudensis HTCC2503]|uniref:Sulfotransferase family protein n=1 Tax=Parvularcula bermudensis (strain ATCC BAA-594 / HTCC2503 / KCTC 12087) TaxID=314260 RepID=E0TGB9_PARBH|nr:sulfotransferase [Parvularcula bermudensis]ADM09162.1 hypothetical protein PB2503_05442 [Parvularcula bermudensis HTCC2503]